MNEPLRFVDLSASQRWLYSAHLLMACGGFALSVGTVLKFLESGTIPHQPIFQTGGNIHETEPQRNNTNRARDFFSV